MEQIKTIDDTEDHKKQAKERQTARSLGAIGAAWLAGWLTTAKQFMAAATARAAASMPKRDSKGCLNIVVNE